MSFGVRGSTGDAEQVLRSRGAEDWIDIDAFVEQGLAEAAEIGIAVEDHGHDGGFAVEEREAAGNQFGSQRVRYVKQMAAAFRFGLDDAQGYGCGGY